ncbi:MAG: FAD:protein FMN transferase [Planctomycetales bacterium]|nr:FAD:protein FMN transferase [Planctomycetales bacterium]
MRSLLILTAVIGVAAAFVAPAMRRGASSASVQTYSGPTMGTLYHYSIITCRAPASIQQRVDSRLAEINKAMSTYDPDSELSRFNKSDSLDWFDVSEETARVVAFALEVSEKTNGAFDPTVGPAVNLWGFGPDGRRKSPPTDEQVSAALARVGYKNVEARLDPPAIKKSRPDVYVDLSAVAKGYGVDEVSRVLAENGSEASMVEIGGEVVCRGAKPDGSPWRIGVEKPDERGVAIQTVVELSDAALATSGDYRNFFQQDGVRFSHTINPQTGRPVEHRLAEVSVRAKSCMENDAYATSILVMGPEKGYNWAQKQNLAVLMIERTHDGFVEKTTPNWRGGRDRSTGP